MSVTIPNFPGGIALAGFGAAGVAAGSMAAGIQAGIGNVAAGSAFAAFQSAGKLWLHFRFRLINGNSIHFRRSRNSCRHEGRRGRRGCCRRRWNCCCRGRRMGNFRCRNFCRLCWTVPTSGFRWIPNGSEETVWILTFESCDMIRYFFVKSETRNKLNFEHFT